MCKLRIHYFSFSFFIISTAWVCFLLLLLSFTTFVDILQIIDISTFWYQLYKANKQNTAITSSYLVYLFISLFGLTDCSISGYMLHIYIKFGVIRHMNRRYILCFIRVVRCTEYAGIWQVPVKDCFQYEDQITIITKQICHNCNKINMLSVVFFNKGNPLYN